MAKAYVPQPGQRVAVKNANDVTLLAAAATGTDHYTAAIAPKGANRIGLYVDVDSSTGTTPTLDITFEVSFDKGTTWVNMPNGANSQTQAAMAQIGDTIGTSFEWYEFAGDPEFTRVRAYFDYGGTTPSYDFGACYWILDYVAKG